VAALPPRGHHLGYQRESVLVVLQHLHLGAHNHTAMDAADVHGQDFVAGSALELVCPAGQHSKCSQAAEGHTGPADSPGGEEGVPRTGPVNTVLPVLPY